MLKGKQSTEFVKAMFIEYIIILVGIILLGTWLLDSSLGTKSLSTSLQRRNNMPLYLPFLVMLGCITTISVGTTIAERFMDDSVQWQNQFIMNMIFGISELIIVVGILLLVRKYFVRRLKGFGFNFRAIPKDFIFAFINLLAIWPVIVVVILLTEFVLGLFSGTEYQLEQHQQLQQLTQYPQVQSRIMVVILAAFIVPLFEEIVFRGLFQTMFRSFLQIPYSAWIAIALSSFLFATMHGNIDHWPVLFVLGVVMGYSYEKSGSLFRPIFIHIMFNSTSLISTLIYPIG